MSRFSATLALGLLAALLAGCPIYDAASCGTNRDCPYDAYCGYDGRCHPSGYGGGTGDDGACRSPSECPANETCGADALCHVGDCHVATTGCVAGYVCDVVDGAFLCVRGTSDDGGTPEGSAVDAPFEATDDAPSEAEPIDAELDAPLVDVASEPAPDAELDAPTE